MLQLMDGCHSSSKTHEKLESINGKTNEHDKRLTNLEKLANNVEQDRRQTNLIIKGLQKTNNPKTSIAQLLSTKLNINITEDDIKFAVIINTRQATNQVTDSYKKKKISASNET